MSCELIRPRQIARNKRHTIVTLIEYPRDNLDEMQQLILVEIDRQLFAKFEKDEAIADQKFQNAMTVLNDRFLTMSGHYDELQEK